jgi:glucose/arabinose dehydrogenase
MLRPQRTDAPGGATDATGTSSPAGVTAPNRFRVYHTLTGLVRPTTFQFAPDGRIFVAEKSGIVRVFDNLNDQAGHVFADLRTQVHDLWDRGLLGMALDPDFPDRPYVYVLYARDAPLGSKAPHWSAGGATADSCPTPPGSTDDGCVISTRLSRLTASGNAMTGPELVLITDWCQQFASHSAGTIAFGADGALYASGGEGANFLTQDWGQFGGSSGSPVRRNPCGDPPAGAGGQETVPTAQGGSLRAQDLRTSGDPVTLDGSLIRVNPDTGAAAAGNPTTGASANANRIVAYGMRNPFRFTFRPGTDELWIGDVGEVHREEIDRIPNPTAGVTNFGWPCYEGPARHKLWDLKDMTICEDLYNDPGATTAPYISYPHKFPTPFPTDACPTDGASISGLAFYEGGNYPAAYGNALFVGDYVRKCIWVVPAGADGLPDASLGFSFITEAGGPIDLKVGPNGDLFYLDYDNNRLERVRYFGGNQPPVARISANHVTGDTPLAVHFDGSASSDPDTDDIGYSWDLDGDGTFGDATTPTADFLYDDPGRYAVRLRITDSHGAVDVAALTITAGNKPPVPTISKPLASLRWGVGKRIDFAGSASDPDEGTLPAADLSWRLVLHHCAAADSCHTHELQDFDGVATGSFYAPDHDYHSYLELTLTATDRGGLSATRSIVLQPTKIQITVTTDPPGLTLGAGEDDGPAPFTFTVIKNSRLALSAPAAQGLDGHAYAFVSWSDGGAATHDVSPSSSKTFTATYQDIADAPVASDAFARLRSSGWGSADTGGAYLLTHAATKFAVADGVGTLRVGAGQTVGARLPVSLRDADLAFSVRVDKVAAGVEQFAYAVARSVDSVTEYRLRLRLRPNGSVVLQVGRATGGGETQVGPRFVVPGLVYTAGVPIHVRAQVVGASPTTIRMRAWADGAVEPSTWDLEVSDSSSALQAPGRVGLLGRLSSSAGNAPVTFSFDDLDVRVAT